MHKTSRARFTKLVPVALLILIAQPVFAADYTPWATPTMAEVVSGGILVYGVFGNENQCSHSDMILYPNTYVDYEVVVSMVLAAISAGRELRFYSNDCTTLGFHGGTVNRSRNGHAIYFR